MRISSSTRVQIHLARGIALGNQSENDQAVHCFITAHEWLNPIPSPEC